MSGSDPATAGSPDETVKTKAAVSDRVQCPVCREPIARGARKCINCGADLDWRRYFGLGNTTLALLTALVAVVSASAPEFVKILTPKVSNLSAHYVGINAAGSALSLFVENSGREAGAIEQIDLDWSINKGGFEVGVTLPMPGSGAIFFGGGKTEGVNVKLDDPRSRPHSASSNSSQLFHSAFIQAQKQSATISGYCSIVPEFTNSDGSRVNPPVDIPCAEAMAYLDRRFPSRAPN